MGGDQLEEGVDVEALLGRDHELVVEGGKPAGGLELLGDLLGTGDVCLGDHQELEVSVGLGHVARHPGVARANRLGGVNEEGHHVGVGELGQRGLVELTSQGVLGLVEARRVDDDELARLGVDDGAHATARGLGDGARDGDLLAHAGVHEGGLARIGTSDEGDKSAPEGGVGVSHLQPSWADALV